MPSRRFSHPLTLMSIALNRRAAGAANGPGRERAASEDLGSEASPRHLQVEAITVQMPTPRASLTTWVQAKLAGGVRRRVNGWASRYRTSHRKNDEPGGEDDWAGLSTAAETVFDSPLQEAIALLTSLGAHMEAMQLQREAESVRRVMQLLHSPGSLHNAKSLQQMVAKGEVQVDPQLMEWLVQMEWLPNTPPREASGAEADDLGGGSSETLSSVEESSVKPNRSSKSSRASALLAPVVLAAVVSANEEELLEMLEDGSKEWEFDTLRLAELAGGHPLAALGWTLLQRHGARTALGTTSAMIQTFLAHVEAEYRAVPYHNSAHAACVCHAVSWILTNHARELSGVVETPLDVVTTLLAAVVHDLNHDGRNNAFHSATGSELALLYSDQSVLEMHHLARAFSILAAPECAILATLPLDVRKDVRARIIGMVLATDLASNFTTINTFKTMLSEHNVVDPATTSAASAAAAAASAASTAAPAAVLPPSKAPSSLGDVSSPPQPARRSTLWAAAAADVEQRRRSWAAAADEKSRRYTIGSAGAAGNSAAAGQPRNKRDSAARLSFFGGGGGGTGSSGNSVLATQSAGTGTSGSLQSAAPPLFTSRPDAMTAAEKLLILKMVVKCADIGNVVKGQQYCLQWTERVVQEFFEQGDAEKRLGLQVTPMMDRELASVPKQQIGFYNFIVRPMYEAMAMLIPLERQFEHLESMQQYWRTKLPQDEEAATPPDRHTKPESHRKDSQRSERSDRDRSMVSTGPPPSEVRRTPASRLLASHRLHRRLLHRLTPRAWRWQKRKSRWTLSMRTESRQTEPPSGGDSEEK